MGDERLARPSTLLGEHDTERAEVAARRRRRTAVLTAGSVALVAVLALSATAAVLHRPAPAPPAGPPSSVAPTPSATPSADPTPVLATKADASEPDARVMTDETWDEVGPGWALTLFSTMSVVVSEDDNYGHFDPAGVQALFLVAPDATTYRLLTLPADTDAEAQVMWWDPERRKAWLFLQGLGESWGQLEVDLVTGSQTPLTFGPSDVRQDPAPVRQMPDGRVLWADNDPLFSASVGGLYWQATDGAFTTIVGPGVIEGDVWLDPSTPRAAYLAPDAAGDYSLVSYDLTKGSTGTRPLGAPSVDRHRCSVADVEAPSVFVTCTTYDAIGLHQYEVTAAGEWREATEDHTSPSTIQWMLGCGTPDVLWSTNGRELSGALAAQGWRDALILPTTPGGPLPVPNRGGACGE
ncbi:hypothetical protein Cch01nite_43360 [Cellulomonas chitinilytica]|uniref:Uncharacterized protein n=1 Tax=Cellulomonas chitinilytica TaxID=398759 RepID=A0A919P7M2_9CELL|nr:hypothetical protein [Cellulomonas chitinilytica]GIG23612.1 hypothetical protein Cch01nite_43360 [Cellulomonas chitinilytica]